MRKILCEAFQDLADQTAKRIKAAHDSGMRWSEESNTEHLLLTLATRYPDQVAISAFTKRREAANGADWEWWFLGASGAYGMRVQAKRIALPNEIFSHLRRRAKGQSRDQMTALIAEAKREGLTPAYCFYTASRHSPVGGCLIGHAQVVEQVMGVGEGITSGRCRATSCHGTSSSAEVLAQRSPKRQTWRCRRSPHGVRRASKV
jgi:hypothetical protein